MILQPQITFQNLPHSEIIENNILDRIKKLDRFYDQIMHCDVVIEEVTKHQHKGRLFKTHINLTVPGHKITVNRASNEDIYVAARDAFDAAKRQLQNFARRRRGDVKSHALPTHGVITRLFPQEGYGFIESDNNEYYFTFDNVQQADFQLLNVDTEVLFLPTSGNEGLQANRITFGKHQKLGE